MASNTRILGQRGEALESLAAPLLELGDDTGDNQDFGYECYFDPKLLGDDGSPELAVYAEQRLGSRLPRKNASAWVSPGVARLFAASRAEDAQWMIRLQSIFLPVSSVRVHGETYAAASWHPTRFGTSRVYITHQDEPGVWRRHASMAGLIASVVAADNETEIDAATREAYRDADAAMTEADDETFPAHLDPEALQVRTRWIGELMLGQHVSRDTSNGLYYNRLEGIPTYDTYAAERPLVEAWPHLQAYWITHHMLMRNREALVEVLEMANDAYPPIPELRAIVDAFDCGHEPSKLVTYGDHQALRWDCVKGKLDTMSRKADQEVRAAIAEHDRHVRVAEETLTMLERGDDEDTQCGLRAWSMLRDSAGALGESERALNKALYPDDESMGMRTMTGETSPFIVAFEDLLATVDERWAPLFEAAFTAAATVDENHANAAPGSLVGWGKALGSFSALHKRFAPLCKSAGRRRYLELAMVADHFYDDPESVPFLEQELTDFMGELASFEHSTTSFAYLALLKRKHAGALDATNLALKNAPLTGGNWQLLLHVFDRAKAWDLAEIVPGMQAAIARDFGRHDDGSRGDVVRTWASMAGVSAIGVLETMLGSLPDVRAECEEAALVAGLLVAQPEHPDANARARPCLEVLLSSAGSMELGAAGALLAALAETDRQGFAGLAGRVREAARASEHTKPPQLKAIETAAAQLVGAP